MATTVLPSTVQEAVQLVRAAAPEYFRGQSELVFRDRLALALMERYGVVEYNVAPSHSFVWDIVTSLPNVTTNDDSIDISFDNHNALEQLVVDMRSYRATDRLSDRQKLLTSGPNQISDLMRGKQDRIIKAIRDTISNDFMYSDGYASGNGERLIGVDSCLGDDGNTVAADKVANPSDTYGGQSTALGSLGGNWSSNLSTPPNATAAVDWPHGKGDYQYDALSPLLVNYSSTSWTSGNTTWRDNCEDAMRFMLIGQQHRGARSTAGNAPPLILLASDLWEEFLQYFSARNHQWVPVKDAEDLGFPQTLYFDGAWVTHEYDCPSQEGRFIQPDMIELFTIQDKLIVPEGPTWVMQFQAYLFLAKFYGNLRLQPKFLGKFKNYA